MTPSIRVTISQKDPEVLKKFARIVGVGNVNGPYKTKTSEVYQWSKGGIDGVRHVAKVLWPYLGTVKKLQANEVIRYKLRVNKERGI